LSKKEKIIELVKDSDGTYKEGKPKPEPVKIKEQTGHTYAHGKNSIRYGKNKRTVNDPLAMLEEIGNQAFGEIVNVLKLFR
jgi:hypothetical protein